MKYSFSSVNSPIEMVIKKVQEPRLPAGSLYVYVTGVIPAGNVLPDAGITLTRTKLPELSVTVALAKDMDTPGTPAAIVLTMSDGHVTTGGILSTEKIQVKSRFQSNLVTRCTC